MKLVFLLSSVFVAMGLLTPQGTPADLKVGDQAPDFTLPGSDGKSHALAQLKGHWVVLAWFPKAFTGG
jgi:peroxiredoxin Q/BCP